MVAAHVSRNPVPADELPALITRIYEALGALNAAPVTEAVPLAPAVPVRASVKPDHVVCLECGRKMIVLTRHLQVAHGLSPAEYRQRWGLATDHPLVAPDYAERRSTLARQSGLGGHVTGGSVAGGGEEPGIEAKPQGRQKREKLTLWRNGEGKASMPQAHDHEAVQNASPDPEPSGEKTLFEAIARLRMVSASYNGREMRLAPHQLFSRHGELFIGAFNAGKNWRHDEEPRLGYFKVSGLSDITLMADTFAPLPTFDGSLPRDGDEQLFAVTT